MNNITRLLFAVAALSFAHAHAQLEKGNVLVGGSISLRSSNSAYTGANNPGQRNVFSFSFNPSISYMVLPGFSVGAILPYHYEKWWKDGPKRTATDYSIGLLTRYYFPFKRWAVFPQISYASGRSTSSFQAIDASTGQSQYQKATGTTRSIKAGFGITYFANKNIGIEGILYSQSSDLKYKNSFFPGNAFTNAVNFDIGIQVYLGRG